MLPWQWAIRVEQLLYKLLLLHQPKVSYQCNTILNLILMACTTQVSHSVAITSWCLVTLSHSANEATLAWGSGVYAIDEHKSRENYNYGKCA
jgi:hypothetical protein